MDGALAWNCDQIEGVTPFKEEPDHGTLRAAAQIQLACDVRGTRDESGYAIAL
jgi:hypothetical protein